MQRTNFKMENSNITMVRGDTVSFNFSVIDGNGQLMNLDSAHFTCKKNPTGQSYTFQKSFDDGIQFLDDCYVVRIAPEDTADVLAGQYYYDLQIGVGDDIFTILRGVLSIEQDVTTN